MARRQLPLLHRPYLGRISKLRPDCEYSAWGRIHRNMHPRGDETVKSMFVYDKKSADSDNSVQDLHSFVLYSYLIGIYNVRSSTLTSKDDNLAVATLI